MAQQYIPPQDDVRIALESRGIDYGIWKALAKLRPELDVALNECYAPHNRRRKFDADLHRCGVKLRLDSYCQKLLQQYPDLRRI